MNVNIKRARLVEFDTLYKDGTVSLLVSRRQSSNAFTPLGVNGEPPTEDWGIWRTHDIVSNGTNIRILAELPVTLADLIPEGCEAFRFKRRYNVELTATRGAGEQADVWTINGMHGLWRGLNKLSDDLGVCLDTVVPLELRVHPQYMEERR